jgi:hypothetical protein
MTNEKLCYRQERFTKFTKLRDLDRANALGWGALKVSRLDSACRPSMYTPPPPHQPQLAVSTCCSFTVDDAPETRNVLVGLHYYQTLNHSRYGVFQRTPGTRRVKEPMSDVAFP